MGLRQVLQPLAHNAVIHFYDAASDMIEMHEQKGEFQRVASLLLCLPGFG